MFRYWTSREKKLGMGVIILMIVVASLLFSIWRSPGDVAQENTYTAGEHGQGEFQSQMTSAERGAEEGSELPGSKGAVDSQAHHVHEEVMVDVKGAVSDPQVYTLTGEDRVQDAIKKAGGLEENASTDTINLAERVSDGMVIYVPTEKEVEEGAAPSLAQGTTSAGDRADTSTRVNLNTASSQDLETLSGIGPSRAEAIIQYREDNGGFSSVEDVMNVSGIGPAIFESIKADLEI